MSEEDLLHDEFLKKRIVVIRDEIDLDMVDQVRTDITALSLQDPKEPIILLIDSHGGEVMPALWLYDYLGLITTPILGLVSGLCVSSAFIVLQGCHERIATRHSTFLLHYVTISIEVAMSGSEPVKISDRLKQGQQRQKEIERIFVSKGRLTPKELRKLMNDGYRYNTFLSSNQVHKFGLIDKVVQEFPII